MTMLPISAEKINCIIYHPHDDEPGVMFWLSDNTTYLNVFHDDRECDEYWKNITHGLHGEDFIRFHDICFRPDRLLLIQKKYIPDRGNCIEFYFSYSQIYIKEYTKSEERDEDLNIVSGILEKFLVIRASRYFSSTKH